jgi:heat shock protein HslJ
MDAKKGTEPMRIIPLAVLASVLAAPALAETMHFDCGGLALEAETAGDALTLRAGGETHRLAAVPAASGTRHEGEGGTLFREHQGEAELRLGARVAPRCLRLAAPAPFRYRASGNEPFWAIEISGTSLRLLPGPGAAPSEALLAPPRLEAGGVVHAAADGTRVTIAPGPCRDTMSGAALPDRVRIETGGRVLEGCGASPAGRLVGAAWRIESIGGAPLAGMRAPVTLDFLAPDAAGGQGPCNRYRGAWRIEGERLVFGPMAATMMMCPEPAMSQEQALFRLFGTLRAHRFDETGALVLEGEGGPLVARR